MQGKYSFWTRLLVCLVAGLLISSYFIPKAGGVGDWVPLLSGFADLSGLDENVFLSALLGGVFNVLICVSLLAINTKSVNNLFNPGFSVAFMLLMMLLNPSAVYFSCIHPAVLLFVWGQFCFISNQKFLSMFLLSCSALFYAPLLLILPLVLLVSVPGASDIPRVALKSLGGLVLPLFYVLCFRYLAFGDANVFMHEYISRAMEFSSPLHNASFASIFLVLCIVVAALHSVSYIFRRLNRNSIVSDHLLKMEFLCAVLGALLFFLFGGNDSVPVSMVAALPVALLFSHYFTGNITAASARVELILLCCAAVINRLYHFI